MRGQPHRAQAGVGADRRLDPQPLVLGEQERGVEGQIVRYQNPAAQQPREVPGEAGELRSPPRLRSGDAMNELRPEVPIGVDQTAPLIGDPAGPVEVNNRHLNDPLVPAGAQTRGLEVDDCVHAPLSLYAATNAVLPTASCSRASHCGGSGCGSPRERR